MSLFIDIFIIIAAIAAIYSGISRGFVKSVMGFVSLILAIAAAFIFTPQLADFYSEKFVSGWVGGIVETSLDELVTAGGQRLELSKIFEDKPDALISVAERFGIDLEEIESYYLEIQPEDDNTAIKSMSEQIASPTAEAISSVLAAISIFLAALIILKLVTFILDLICRLPVLSTLNSLLGFVFGLANAAVSAWAIANIAVGLISALNAVRPDIFNPAVIDGSIIVKFFCDQSLILFK